MSLTRVRSSDYIEIDLIQLPDVTKTITPGKPTAFTVRFDGQLPDGDEQYGDGGTDIYVASTNTFERDGSSYFSSTGVAKEIRNVIGRTISWEAGQTYRTTTGYDRDTLVAMRDCDWAGTYQGSRDQRSSGGIVWNGTCESFTPPDVVFPGGPRAAIGQEYYRDVGEDGGQRVLLRDYYVSVKATVQNVLISLQGIEQYFSSTYAAPPAQPDGQVLIQPRRSGEIQSLEINVDESFEGLDSGGNLAVDWRIGSLPDAREMPRFGLASEFVSSYGVYGGHPDGFNSILGRTRSLAVVSGTPSGWVGVPELATLLAQEKGPARAVVHLAGIPTELYSPMTPDWLPSDFAPITDPNDSYREDRAARWQLPAMRARVRPPAYAYTELPELWPVDGVLTSKLKDTRRRFV